LLTKVEDTELTLVKRRCVKLLGQVGGVYNQALLTNSNARLPVAWCPDKLLKFDIPFVDMKPTIYLGRIYLFRSYLSSIYLGMIYLRMIYRVMIYLGSCKVNCENHYTL